MQTRPLPLFLSQERSNVAAKRRSAASPRFPGDPGVGRYYIGWSRSTANLTDENGNPLTYINTVTNYCQKAPDIIHDYNANGCISSTIFDAAIGNGALASMTFKFRSVTTASDDFTQITSGAGDATLLSSCNIAKARAPYPAWCCFFHEPEDFITDATKSSQYRAAYRYIVNFFRNQGVTNVAWTTILSFPFAITGGSGGSNDWRRLHPDWRGTGTSGAGTAADWYTGSERMMDILGYDTYNAGVGSTTMRDFDTDVADVIDQGLLEDGFTAAYGLDVPRAIFETGMSADTNPYPTWTDAWGPDMRRHMLKNHVGVCYWNSNTDVPPRYDFKAASDASYPSKLTAWRMVTGASTNFDAPG